MRLRDTHFLHQLDGTVLGHALGQMIRILGGAILQIIHQRHGLLRIVLAVLRRDLLTEVLHQVGHGADEVLMRTVAVHQIHRHHGCHRLALRLQLIVLHGLPLEAALLLGVMLQAHKVAVDVRQHTGLEHIGLAVLIQGQMVDGLFHRRRCAIRRSLALALIQLLALEHGQLLLQYADGALLGLVGLCLGIAQRLLDVRKERQHEAVVQRLACACVDVRNALPLGIGAAAVAGHVANAEEVRLAALLRLLHLLLQRVQHRTVFRLLTHLKALAELFHLRQLLGEGCVIRRNQVRIVHALASAQQTGVDLTHRLAILLQQRHVRFINSVFRLEHALLRVLIGIVQLHANGGEAVEFLALSLNLSLYAFALAGCHTSRNDVLFQLAQHGVEPALAVGAALLIVEHHGLGQLLADLHDGVQRGQRVLEHHGQLVTAQGVEFFLGDLQKVTAVINDLAVIHHGVARQNAHHRTGGH